MIILEVDKESVELVYHKLKDTGSFKNLFLRPDESVINTYVSESIEPIVVKSMVSKAPITRVKSVLIPTIEKILVDLFCDEKIFFAFQGQQLIRIYEGCLDKYIINYSKLFNYARRRKREDPIKEFVSAHFNEKVKDRLE